MMGRPPGLAGLRRHHADGREQAERLEAVACEDPEARTRECRRFLERFDREMVPHMLAEERGLLPLLLGDDPRVVRILRDHECLHVLARRLREALAAGPPPADGMLRIAALLRDHIALEEGELYPEAAGRLGRRGAGVVEGLRRAAPEGVVAGGPSGPGAQRWMLST